LKEFYTSSGQPLFFHVTPISQYHYKKYSVTTQRFSSLPISFSFLV